MFWKKKKVKEEPKKPVKERKIGQERQTIKLNVTDNCFIRARKILVCSGISCPERFADSMARVIKMYMDLDEEYNKPKAKTKKENRND